MRRRPTVLDPTAELLPAGVACDFGRDPPPGMAAIATGSGRCRLLVAVPVGERGNGASR
jgi:hypothetical protein